MGLKYLAELLNQSNPKINIEMILPLLQKQKLNVYESLDDFIAYLSKKSITVSTIRLYFNGVKSYFEYNDVDIVPNKFRRRVKMPKYYPDPEEPLTMQDIREMLINAEMKGWHAILCY